MRATRFEFEQRFWIIGAIFGIGFSLASFDHILFAFAILRVFDPSLDPDSARAAILLRLTFAAAALLIFSAAALRTWATAYLRTEIVHDARQHSEAVIADGPFRYTRNPLYLANLPMAAGIGVLASRLGWLFIVLAIWVFVYRLILREEDGLLRSQGESYRNYLKRVPRFWPSLTPRVPSSGAQPRWGQAFAGESLVWLFGLSMLCLALTLNIRFTALIFALSFVVYFFAVYFTKKRTASSSRA